MIGFYIFVVTWFAVADYLFGYPDEN